MKTEYLTETGDRGEFQKRHLFTDEEVARQAAERHNGIKEPESIQDRQTLKLYPRWSVRLTWTSVDRQWAKLKGQKDVRDPWVTAEFLAKPAYGFQYAVSDIYTHPLRGDDSHGLQFTSPLRDLYAAFTISTCRDYVYLHTTNWKYEDEYHGWLTVEDARKLWKRMVDAGYEAF